MIRKFKLYIQDIIDSIHNLQEYTSGKNFIRRGRIENGTK